MAIRKLLNKMQEVHQEALHKEETSHKNSSDHDESNWLISYADMMTLLCGFFIMLFALSNIEQEKYSKMAEEVSKHFGGNYENPNETTVKYFTQILNEAGLQNVAVARAEHMGVSIVFESTVFFDTLSAFIKESGRSVMDKLIQAVQEREKTENRKFEIVVEGHTDSRPILSGTYPSNWELSSSRAARVVRMFLDSGFEPSRLTAIGYADTRPELPNRTPSGQWNEEALQKNRRVVIQIRSANTTH